MQEIGLPLTWKTWKVREFERDPSKSGNLPKKSGNWRQNSKSQGIHLSEIYFQPI